MSAAGREWAEGFFEKLLRETMQCHRAEVLTIVECQAADCDAAEAARLFQDRVVHWREIARRRIDDLQHLGGRGLTLERFAGLGQKSRVLDGYDRLVGEGAHELDLPFCERLHPLAGKPDHPDGFARAQQRYAQRRSKFSNRSRLRVKRSPDPRRYLRYERPAARAPPARRRCRGQGQTIYLAGPHRTRVSSQRWLHVDKPLPVGQRDLPRWPRRVAPPSGRPCPEPAADRKSSG